MDNEKSNVVVSNDKFAIESKCVFNIEALDPCRLNAIDKPYIRIISDEVCNLENSYRRFVDNLPMTPEKFKEEMAMVERVYNDDPETMHEKMDYLMANTLRKLGYGDGVDIFDRVTKWYA